MLQLLHRPGIEPGPLPCSGGLLLASVECRILHRAPPSIEVAEQRCVNMLVSEMLKRSAEERNACCSE